MDSWKSRAVIATTLLTGCTLLAGCTGQIGSPTPGEQGPATGPGPGTGSSTDSGGVPPGSVDADGDGVTDGQGIDSDGDGVIDGIDSDGDGVIDQVVDPQSVCTPGVVLGTSQLPRLTHIQYDNTIRDLTGLNVQASATLAPDGGDVDQRAWDAYLTTGATLAQQIMADPTARAQVITCTPSGDGAACAQQFIAEFGQRAFRRPLTVEETARFQALFDNRATLTETGSFDEAALLILEAMLVSPSFLTRAEIAEQAEGQYLALNGYEVASRLSYMLWASMPDQALMDAAAGGQLATKEQILAQAQRMLQDPKARARVADFHEHYAHMGPGTRWAEISRDTAVYPAFNEAMVPVISQETERLFDFIVFDQQGTFQDLITSPVAFVNSTTAPLYGLDATQYGADLTQVSLDATQRPGIFTRAGFLTSHASFNRTSPILRGAFLQKEVLCTEIPPPPPDVEGTPLPMDPNLVTNRQRVDAQTAASACANCHHTVINPTGFALEGFDAIGAIQATDNGQPVDTASSVPIGNTFVDVTGAADLMNAIANSAEAQTCYAKKWVTYAYERTMNPADACLVNEMAGKLTQGGYTVANLIADLTQSDSFRLRALEQ